MGEWPLSMAVREFFAGILFKMFLKCIQLAEDEYFDLIYFQESAKLDQEWEEGE